MALKKTFEAAAKSVQELPRRPDNDTLLELYGWYKQGTEGDVTGSRPGMLDIKGRKKYDAWAARRGISLDQAQEAYVALVRKLEA